MATVNVSYHDKERERSLGPRKQVLGKLRDLKQRTGTEGTHSRSRTYGSCFARTQRSEVHVEVFESDWATDVQPEA